MNYVLTFENTSFYDLILLDYESARTAVGLTISDVFLPVAFLMHSDSQ